MGYHEFSEQSFAKSSQSALRNQNLKKVSAILRKENNLSFVKKIEKESINL